MNETLLPFKIGLPDLVAETRRGEESATRALGSINSTAHPDKLYLEAIEQIGALDVDEAARLRAFCRVIQKRLEADLLAHADGGRPPRLAWRRPDGTVVATNAARRLAAIEGDGDA
jgi:hypothetical protein